MAARAAMTVGEVFIVVSAVLLLVGLVLPAIHLRSADQHQGSLCGNHLKQLFTALIAYEQDFNRVPPGGPKPVDAHEARLTTVRAFACIADAQDLSDKLFRCELDRSGWLGDRAARARDPVAWGGTAAHHVSYAFDWAAPMDTAAERVVMADRSPRHHGDALVVFGDCHVMRLRCRDISRSGGHHTEDADGNPVGGIWSSVDSPPTAEDSIYDDLGDDGDELAPGEGSATRAWVK